jgi:butyryl-CoA dehydrogenase
MIGAFCLTEPNAGSDASAIETIAEKGESGSYIVNGQKAYITNGGWADIYLVFCRTVESGISVLITDWGTEGVERGNPEDLCGMRGNPVCSLYLSDAPVSADNLLGSEGEGLAVAMDALDNGRIGIGAQGVGIAQAALDASLRYSRERVQFRKPISSLQTIQNYLADMATEIEAARLLVFRAASMKDKKVPFRRQAAMAKYYATRTAMSAATLAVQIHGAYGYSKAYPVERYFRDAKVTEIYEGANEVQRLVIARSLLDDLERGVL